MSNVEFKSGSSIFPFITLLLLAALVVALSYLFPFLLPVFVGINLLLTMLVGLFTLLGSRGIRLTVTRINKLERLLGMIEK